MKLTSSMMALAAILGLALASAPITLQAQTTTTPAAPASAKKEKSGKPVEYQGNITAIDATSVTVATTSKVLPLTIASTTKYKKDKKAATLADFAIGDKVTGSYTKDANGKLTAYSVHKTSLAASTKEAKTTATSAANSAIDSATPASVPAPAAPPVH